MVVIKYKKTFLAAPNSLLTLLKEHVRCDLKHLKKPVLKMFRLYLARSLSKVGAS